MADNSGFVQAQGVVTYGNFNPLDNVWRAIGVESVTDAGGTVEVILQNGMDPDGVAIQVTPDSTGEVDALLPNVRRIPGGFSVVISAVSGSQPGPRALGRFWFSVMQIPRDCAFAPVL